MRYRGRVWRAALRPTLWAFSLLALLAPVAVLSAFAWQRRWITDDAFIDLRVVRNLLEGHGPVFNLGERVEAYSNPLWVALLALGGLLFRSLDGGPPLEWLALWLGLLLTLAGFVAAQSGALLLLCDPPGHPPGHPPSRPLGHPPGYAPRNPAQHTTRDPLHRRLPAFSLPLGILALAPLSAQWDFTTSGLETGLTTCWLGMTFLAVAARPRWLTTAALAGSGAVIRPDLLIFSVGFLPPLLLRSKPLHLARLTAMLTSFLLLPLAYQLFRMGYFAALVPNTGLAKEAGLSRWDQGWIYLKDFAGTYRLWVPLAAASVWWLGLAVRLAYRRRWADLSLAISPVACAALYAAGVVRAGGDFMHGRLLLPPLFALLLPVAAIGVSSPRLAWLPVLPLLIVLPWAVTAARDYRPPYFAKGNGVGPQGIADERTFYVQFAGYQPHPITLADYAAGVWTRDGFALRAVAETAAQRGERILLPTKDWLVERGPNPPPPQLPLAPSSSQWLDPRIRVVAHRNNVGLTGYAAGFTVHLVDHLGLADPLASRLRLEQRKRPGHEKELPDAWVLARFGSLALPSGSPTDRPIGLASQTSAAVDAAHRSLTCPGSDLSVLLDAITQPLTWSRFWQNVALSPRLTQLRFSADPLRAEAELCP